MKKITLALLLIIACHLNGRAQCHDEYYCIEFNDTVCLEHVKVDTTINNNIWKIGSVDKPLFGMSNCIGKGIMTDTVNPYPVNNHSVFTITNRATTEDVFGIRTLSVIYQVQTDSLKDYGTIEFSLDKGATWIDMIKDTVYQNHINWWAAKPVLTGNSHGCIGFTVDLWDLKTIHPINVGDTILFRFSFFSDSIADNLGGIMYDNICFGSFVEGLSKIRFTAIASKAYPNPASGVFTIAFDNPNSEVFQLTIYNMHSQPMLKREDIRGNKIVLNAGELIPGDYVYKITNEAAKKRSWGRLTVTR